MAKIISIGPNPLNPSEEYTFTNTVPDEDMYETVLAICQELGYQSRIKNPDYNIEDPESLMYIINPEGPGTFVWRKTFEWWETIRKTYLNKEKDKQSRIDVDAYINDRRNYIIIGDEE